MKFQFKVQQYQTEAVDAVVTVLPGSPRSTASPIALTRAACQQPSEHIRSERRDGLRAEERRDCAQPGAAPREHPRHTAQPEACRCRTTLADSKAAPGAPNLDVEMETGTGKTYVYIKTMMELNKRYGWSKFIVVVPSIAIREGVKKSFDITADHFQQLYGTKPRSFIYNSSQLHELERFSSDAGVQVMIINIQAFNSTGKDNRRIYDELDDFQSRRPIDVISANRPIVIIDEPQKIGAQKSLEALAQFNALMVLRYSATHRVEHNKVHRLDAVDAYNQKLVKRIAVRGITVKGLAGTTAYLYLDAIEIAKGAKPRARVELEVQTKGGPIKRQVRRLDKGANLHDISGGLEAYKGLFVTDIDANRDVIELSNGDIVVAGQLADRDVTEESKRRIQIREVIRAHIDKERQLFAQDIKVLSLFFIDEVAKYRDYGREDTLGDYARVFEEEYEARSCRGARRTRARPGDGGVPGIPAARPGGLHPRGVLLDRQEDQPSGRSHRRQAWRGGRPVERRRCLRPHSEEQGTIAVARGTRPVHLLSLGASRGVGQPQRVRHGDAQEERQHHLPPPRDRSRPPPRRRPARRAHGQPRHRSRHQRADRRDRRVIHRLRRRPAEGDRRVTFRPAPQGESRVLRRQGAERTHNRRRTHDLATIKRNSCSTGSR